MNALPGAFGSVMQRMPRAATPARAALELAAAGVPVFPVSDTKQPLTRHGFHDASTDPRQVTAWWASDPNAGLAIPTGKASGVVVVDVDVHGTNGYDALDQATRRRLLDGWELAVETPSGGRHLYFPADPHLPQPCWQVARAGIDFRGDGGYVVVPPSAREINGVSESYTVTDLARGRAMPVDAERLREFLDPRPKPAARPVTSFDGGEVDRLASWVSRLQEGERNHGLFWAACTMAEHGVATGEALDALTTAGASAGLSEREVLTTVRSAFRTVHGSPSTVARASASQARSPSPPVVRPAQVLS